MSDQPQRRTVAAVCRACGRQLTVDEFRNCRGIGHFCSDHLPSHGSAPRLSASSHGASAKPHNAPRRREQTPSFADRDPIRGQLRELQHWISKLNYVNSLRTLDPIRRLMKELQELRETGGSQFTPEHHQMLERAISAYQAKMAMLHNSVLRESETARKQQDAASSEDS